MFTIASSLVVGLYLGLGLGRVRFFVWLVSCYAHVFVLLWVVIVTLLAIAKPYLRTR